MIFAPFLLSIFSYKSLVFPFGGQGLFFMGEGKKMRVPHLFFYFLFFLWLRFFSQISALLSSPLSFYFSFFISSYGGQDFSHFFYFPLLSYYSFFYLHYSTQKHCYFDPLFQVYLKNILIVYFLVLCFSCFVLFLS